MKKPTLILFVLVAALSLTLTGCGGGGSSSSTPGDLDGDGVINALDAFPNDPAASVDSDGDGFPDAFNANATEEQLAATVLTLDAFPADPAISLDSDGDGFPDAFNVNATPEQIAACTRPLDLFPDDPDDHADADDDGVGDNKETRIRAAAVAVLGGSLAGVSVPEPENLYDFLMPGSVARTAAIQLGKALFWDMQVGSDGQACGSCHFHAGADNRTRNQLNPGSGAGDPTFGFTVGGAPRPAD
jgi:hypothetical protein